MVPGSLLLLCCCLQMDFFLRFQKASQHVIIGKRSFDLLRPFWMKCMKERNVCCYIYHIEFQELLQGLNYMRLRSGIHFVGTCTCNCNEVFMAPSSNGIGCHGKNPVFNNLRDKDSLKINNPF